MPTEPIDYFTLFPQDGYYFKAPEDYVTSTGQGSAWGTYEVNYMHSTCLRHIFKRLNTIAWQRRSFLRSIKATLDQYANQWDQEYPTCNIPSSYPESNVPLHDEVCLLRDIDVHYANAYVNLAAWIHLETDEFLLASFQNLMDFSERYAFASLYEYVCHLETKAYWEKQRAVSSY